MTTPQAALVEALANADSAFVNLTCKLPSRDSDAEFLADALNRIRAALAQAEAAPKQEVMEGITYAETQQARAIVIDCMITDLVSGDRPAKAADRAWLHRRLQEVMMLLTGEALAAQPQQPAPVPAGWQTVAQGLPPSGQVVLACYVNRSGKLRRIRAEWIAAKSREANIDDSDIGIYDEATDTFYDPEGWYERMDNWDDYSAVAVTQGEVTHWMPLPAAPQTPAGEKL